MSKVFSKERIGLYLSCLCFYFLCHNLIYYWNEIKTDNYYLHVIEISTKSPALVPTISMLFAAEECFALLWLCNKERLFSRSNVRHKSIGRVNINKEEDTVSLLPLFFPSV